MSKRSRKTKSVSRDNEDSTTQKVVAAVLKTTEEPSSTTPSASLITSSVGAAPRNNGPSCTCGRQRTVEELKENYEDCEWAWTASAFYGRLEKIFTQLVFPHGQWQIEDAIIVALGCLSNPDEHEMGIIEDSMFQLVVFGSWISFLKSKYPALENVYVQDPTFNTVDVQFLQDVLGYTVLEDEMAHAVIKPTSFVFAPFAPINYLHSLLHVAHPSFLVSSRVGMIGLPEQHTKKNWFLSQKMVKDFYCSHNFGSLGKPNCWGDACFEDELYWLEQLFLYYPVVKENPNLSSETIDKWCNASNVEIREGYELLPRDLSFEETFDEELDEDWLGIGPGTWQSNGYVLNAVFKRKLRKTRKLAEAKAARVGKRFKELTGDA